MNTIPEIWDILRRKSVRLIVANVMERIIFDRLNRIDTITQVPKEAFSLDLASLAHGSHYSSSWTSEIRFGFRVAKDFIGGAFENYAFIDVGCGKGKVQIVWEHLLRRHRLKQRVLGLDYSDVLIEQAKKNYRKVIGRDGIFIVADAGLFDFNFVCQSIIIYIYNPFDDKILSQMLSNLKSCEVVLIYNNPVHLTMLLSRGFRIIKEKRGFHPQADTTVFRRGKCQQGL